MPARAPEPVGPSAWLLPDPATVDGEVVGVGADLEPATLVDAYRRGIFPWPHEGLPLPWFSPDPRGLIGRGSVRVTRSLRQRLRRSGWETTVDAAFVGVIRACAGAHDDGTWITADMQAAYARLHELGWSHSVEVWDGDELIGGLYGVQLGACFTGESMFRRATDASKVALVDLADRFFGTGGAFIDVQVPTDHLESLGAVAVARDEFLARLADARDRPVQMDDRRAPVSRLV